MRMKMSGYSLILILAILALGLWGVTLQAADAPRVSIHKAKSWLEANEVFILDVRPQDQFETSQYKLAEAEYRNPQKLEQWADALPKNKRIVIYCA